MCWCFLLRIMLFHGKILIKNNTLLWEMLHTHLHPSKCLILRTQVTKVLTAVIYPQGGDAGRSQRG